MIARHGTGLLLAALLSLGGCGSLSVRDHAQAEAIAEAAQSTAQDCDRADHCAEPSGLLARADADIGASTPTAPRHDALLLDQGQDSLLARVHLIRAAKQSIDLQTYIFAEDDAGRMVLRELVAAARRGVKVRVILDQLSAMEKVDTLAALAGLHRNLEVRVYNPIFNQGKLKYPQYLLATIVSFRRLNQRMHTKLLLVDERVGITGGRNYQDDYYDWDPDFNFIDRDVLVAGPVATQMRANFDAFWSAPLSVPVAALNDVGRVLLAKGVPALPQRAYEQPERVRSMQSAASEPETLAARLVEPLFPVGRVDYAADLPAKHERPAGDDEGGRSSQALRAVGGEVRDELIMQTPYLVLSHAAQRGFHALAKRPHAPRVLVSTNSLAATDNVLTWALAYKYRRRYLKRFHFEIHELKPYPTDAPLDVAATGALGSQAAARAPLRLGSAPLTGHHSPFATDQLSRRSMWLYGNRQVPLKRAGVRAGLHAKSIVIDREIAIIGTHNFDQRSDHYNTESAVIVHDPAFATATAESIERDMDPANAWVVAPRNPLASALDDTIVSSTEQLPVFDLWPTRYATDYAFVAGGACQGPVHIDDPRFRQCYRPVGDFPEVTKLGFKWWLTRAVTAFGAGMAPFL